MDSLRNAAHGAFKKAAEAVLPPLTKSQFEEKRVRSWRGANRSPATMCPALTTTRPFERTPPHTHNRS
jgi:hypothetical protein